MKGQMLLNFVLWIAEFRTRKSSQWVTFSINATRLTFWESKYDNSAQKNIEETK
jgi:hypothetical protein